MKRSTLAGLRKSEFEKSDPVEQRLVIFVEGATGFERAERFDVLLEGARTVSHSLQRIAEKNATARIVGAVLQQDLSGVARFHVLPRSEVVPARALEPFRFVRGDGFDHLDRDRHRRSAGIEDGAYSVSANRQIPRHGGRHSEFNAEHVTPAVDPRDGPVTFFHGWSSVSIAPEGDSPRG
ncbi:MAG TPA: hypothetical protein VH740_04560 [Vicinamibacterales bacterium]